MASGWSVPPHVPRPFVVMNQPTRVVPPSVTVRAPIGVGAFGYGPPPPPPSLFMAPASTSVFNNQRRALLPCPPASTALGLMGPPVPLSQHPNMRRRAATGTSLNQPPFMSVGPQQPIRLNLNPNSASTSNSNTASRSQVRTARNSDSPRVPTLSIRRPPTPVASFGSSPQRERRFPRRNLTPPPPPSRDFWGMYDDDDDLDMMYDYRIEFEPYDMFSEDSDDDMYSYYAMHPSMRPHTPPARLRGGYEAQFVTAFSSEIQSECSICLSILREPFLVDCCGYRFCKTCIDTVEEDNKPCPLCNEDFSTFPDKQLQRILNQRDVYCKHKEDGCEWIGALSTLDGHLNVNFDDTDKRLEGCEYTQLKCSHCESLILRKDFKLHNIRCSGENYTCEYCNEYTASYRKVSEDHWPECHAHPVECSDCNMSLKRSELPKHLACDCPHTIVPCDLAHFGCDVQLPRTDMASHIENGTIDHVSMLTTKVREARDENEQLKVEFADLAFELHCQQEMNVQIQADNDMLLEELEEKENELEIKTQEVERLRKKLAADSSTQSNKFTHPSHVPPPGKVLISPQNSPMGNRNKTMLVTNLPPGANEQKLKSLFGQYGRVSKVTIMKNSVAVLTFEHTDAIRKAMEKSNTSGGLNLHGCKLSLFELKEFV